MKSRRSLFGSIGSRLAVAFCLVFVAVLLLTESIAIFGVPFTTYSGRWGQQRDEAAKSLNLVADLKKERLQRMLEEWRDDAHVLASNHLVAEQVLLLRAALRDLEASGMRGQELWSRLRRGESYRALEDFFDNVGHTYGRYHRINISEAWTDRVILSTDEAFLGTDASVQIDLDALGISREDVKDIEMDEDDRLPHFHVNHLIEDDGGNTIGALIMEVDTDYILTPMLQTGEGLGRRGEALLVNRQGKILTSLKHPLADGTRPGPLEYKIIAKPAVFAAAGKEGLIEAEDYRGEPVLAAYRHIRVTPEWGWGLVVKRDRSELFAPLRRDILYTVFLGLAGILAFMVLAVTLAGSLTRPLRSLSRTAGEVAAGNFSARGTVYGTDEVGLLAETFNDMLERVENWQMELEDQVRARTSELVDTTDRLRGEIVQRERAEAEREALIAELERKNAELERFTYTVSHDLKSPLITIKGFMGMLERDALAGNEERMQEDMARISGAVAKMRQLLDELLELSRIGRVVNPPENVSLARLAQEAVELVAGQIAERGVHVEVSPDLPTVYGDRPRLLEVLQNLVDNAVKFMGDQSEPRVEIGVRRENARAVCYVSDNGMGIESRYHVKIFGLFDKLDPSDGTGVGLALVKRIVEVHGGRIWVESGGRGQGSTLCFTLPEEEKANDGGTEKPTG